MPCEGDLSTADYSPVGFSRAQGLPCNRCCAAARGADPGDSTGAALCLGPGCPSQRLPAAGRSTSTALAAGINSKMLGIDLFC